jgi:hypothetical protein
MDTDNGEAVDDELYAVSEETAGGRTRTSSGA